MEKKAGDPNGFSGEKSPQSLVIPDRGEATIDHFYEKLGKLNESSGLSLVFNLRETMLNLHLLYQEVMKRGGFYQVTKLGKWAEVASASNSKSSISISAAQLQNFYEILLLQYELMYCRKIPGQAYIWPEKSSQVSCTGLSPSYSKGKRKHFDSSSSLSKVYSGDRDGPADKRKYSDDTCQVATGPETIYKNSTMIPTSNYNVKESIVDPNAPLRRRSGYHIFLRLETRRLKMIHGERSDSVNLREMAIDAWRSLSDKDKEPYMEASKIDKERYDKEMSSYNKQVESNNNNGEGERVLSNDPTPNFLEADDVYHVSLEADSGEILLPDESIVELAIEEMKNAQSNDPIFRIHWDSVAH